MPLIFTNSMYDDVKSVEFDLSLMYDASGLDEMGVTYDIDNLKIDKRYVISNNVTSGLKLIELELKIKSDILKSIMYDMYIILFSFHNMKVTFNDGRVIDVNDCNEREYALLLGMVTILMNDNKMEYSLD